MVIGDTETLVLALGAVGWFIDLQVKNWRGTSTAQGKQSVTLATLEERVNGLSDQVQHFAADRKDHQAQALEQAQLIERVDQMAIRMTEGLAALRAEIKPLAVALEGLLMRHARVSA